MPNQIFVGAPFDCPSVRQPARPSVRPSIRPPARPSVRPSILRSVSPSVRPAIHVFLGHLTRLSDCCPSDNPSLASINKTFCYLILNCVLPTILDTDRAYDKIRSCKVSRGQQNALWRINFYCSAVTGEAIADPSGRQIVVCLQSYLSGYRFVQTRRNGFRRICF